MATVAKETRLDMKLLNQILSEADNLSSEGLIPILQEIQERYGYLPREVLAELGRLTGIPASQIYGVATFYEQFHLEPRGRHTIRCCRGTACHVRNAPDVIDAVERELNIKAGETTEDMEFTFETVACLGVCALAPVVVVDGTYYGQMTPSGVRKVLADFVEARKEAE